MWIYAYNRVEQYRGGIGRRDEEGGLAHGTGPIDGLSRLEPLLQAGRVVDV